MHALTYSASPGTYILAGSADRSIRLYNPQPSTAIHPESSSNSNSITGRAASTAGAVPEGRLIQTYAAHGYEVLSLCVSRSNARFASAGGDRLAFLWDVSTAQTIRRLGGGSGTSGHAARINCVAFAGTGAGDDGADESLLVTGSLDASVRVWDLRSGGGGGGKPVQVLQEARDSVTSVCIPEAGHEIVAGSVDGRVRAYDVRTGRCTTDVVGPPVTSLAPTRDGRALLVGALDSRLRLLDRDSGALLRAYAHPGFRNDGLRVQSVLGGDDRWVVAGDEMTAPSEGSNTSGGGGDPATPTPTPTPTPDGRLWAWDVLTGEVVARVRVPWGPPGHGARRKRVVGRDGKEKERANVLSCLAWRDGGHGDQFCAGGTSGVVTVFGHHRAD